MIPEVTNHELCVQRRSKANGKTKQPDKGWIWDEYFSPDRGEDAIRHLQKQRTTYPHNEYRLIEEITTETVLLLSV